MSRLMSSFVLLLIPCFSFAQQGKWLSPQAQSSLEDLYCSNTTTLVDEDLESSYLSTCQSFLNYLAYEKLADADLFYSRYDLFVDRSEETPKFQMMLINLSIQKTLLKLMQGDDFEGARSFYYAHRLFKRLDAKSCGVEYVKLQALFDVFLAQIPNQHQFWASFLGLSGNADKGFDALTDYQKFVSQQDGIYTEALVLHAYCLLKFGDVDDSTVNRFVDLAIEKESPILSFVSTSLAIKNRMGKEGMRLCNQLPQSHYNNFPLLFYLKGRLELNSISDDCLTSFAAYHQNYKGNSFKADALMREAWWFHVNGENLLRDNRIGQCNAIKVFPTSNDKQSKTELQTLNNEPDELLKVRLLYDGGYYDEALQLISNIEITSLSIYYLAEYHYRKARLYQELEEENKAIEAFKLVVNICSDDERYIGPYAALELAKHCISTKQVEVATSYLEKAEELNTGQYKNDIRHKIHQLTKEVER